MKWHLLVIDIQAAFASHIENWDAVCTRSQIMIQAADRLGIPIIVTEQYPEKLGATVPEIKKVLPDTPLFSKMAFSCLADPEVANRVTRETPVNLLLIGIETHVCVLQTALDALNNLDGVTPYVIVDAVGSRKKQDREVALRRLEKEGAILTTSESVIFELLEQAGTEAFKKVLPLVK